jgi:hypothetical protein
VLGCLLEDSGRVVASGFGGSEDGGEGGPGVFGEDLFGVAGQDLVQGAGIPMHRVVKGMVPGECGEAGGGYLVVGGLQVGERLTGGGHLPFVVVHLAAALDCEDDEDGGVQEHGQPGVVRRLIAHGLERAPQCAGVLVVGAGAGVGGMFEGDSCTVEFSLESDRSMGG